MVASLARPGGNVTGLSLEAPELAGKRLSLLKEAVPHLQRLAVLEQAFAGLKDRADAVYVCSADPLMNNNRDRINALALAEHMPTFYGEKPYVESGGLMSYGPKIPDLFRRAAELVDKILKGAKPADIPVEQPTTFEMDVNLKTAKALGITFPSMLLVAADEVIE
jgi:putative ABC transport system substrate-binding protein